MPSEPRLVTARPPIRQLAARGGDLAGEPLDHDVDHRRHQRVGRQPRAAGPARRGHGAAPAGLELPPDDPCDGVGGHPGAATDLGIALGRVQADPRPGRLADSPGKSVVVGVDVRDQDGAHIAERGAGDVQALLQPAFDDVYANGKPISTLTGVNEQVNNLLALT